MPNIVHILDNCELYIHFYGVGERLELYLYSFHCIHYSLCAYCHQSESQYLWLYRDGLWI